MANIQSDVWPYTVSEMGDKETTFEWKVATIHSDSDRFDKYQVTFVEDETRETGKDGNQYRPYWELKGDWPQGQMGGRPLPYKGRHYPPGTKVKVKLSIRKWVSNDGVEGESREIKMPRRGRDNTIQQTFIELYDDTGLAHLEQQPTTEPVTTEPYVDKWDLKDIHIRKAQALNLLTEVLTSGDTVNAPKIVKAMGFTDDDEAVDAVANGWNLLRRGLAIEFPVAVSDMEEEATEEAVTDGGEEVTQVDW
tara:strand:+ start:10 stop:759 length:750 start_codon:yes stop_codon:yes gene_type:complete